MKALVLAGGSGTRLRPLTYTLPKQLVPVANRPIIHYVMDHLAEAQITDVGVIVAPQTGDRIRAALEPNPWGFSLTYLPQDEPRGLAHAVLTARDFLGEEPFVMYLGDNLVSRGIAPLISEFQARKADAAVLLKQVSDPSRFGVVVVDGGGRIERLDEKPREPQSDLALVGIYCFSPAIHEAVAAIAPSERGELEITDAIQRLLEQGGRVFGARLEGWWLDCGKKDDLLEANRVVLDEWIRPGVRGDVDASSRIHGQVVVEKGARVRRSTVSGPAIVGAGSVVTDSFVGPYSSIGPNCTITDSNVAQCVVLAGARIDGVARLEDSIVGENAVVRRVSTGEPVVRLMIGEDTEVLL